MEIKNRGRGSKLSSSISTTKRPMVLPKNKDKRLRGGKKQAAINDQPGASSSMLVSGCLFFSWGGGFSEDIAVFMKKENRVDVVRDVRHLLEGHGTIRLLESPEQWIDAWMPFTSLPLPLSPDSCRSISSVTRCC